MTCHTAFSTKTLTLRTALRAGSWNNHNTSLRVRTSLRAGAWNNHNSSLRVRTSLRAGGWSNHNTSVLRCAATVRRVVRS